MKTKCEHYPVNSAQTREKERGNALVYVLIAIVLFAALSFTLSRNTDTSEAGGLEEDRAEIYASQIISYAAQAKSVIDQMEAQGVFIEEVDFTLPNDPNFDTNNPVAPIYKVYHPQGGGLNLGTLNDVLIDDSNITTPADPAPGWYMGRFNNVEWSASNNTDIILVAYGINPTLCRILNEKIDPTLSPNPPVMTDSAKEAFVERQIPFGAGTQTNFTTGANVDLTTQGGSDICTACDQQASLCVQGSDGVHAFYSVLADR
ncbi:MAG: hypothetical protein ACLFR0_02260 [Alphaproteobacteria bacterium]